MTEQPFVLASHRYRCVFFRCMPGPHWPGPSIRRSGQEPPTHRPRLDPGVPETETRFAVSAGRKKGRFNAEPILELFQLSFRLSSSFAAQLRRDMTSTTSPMSASNHRADPSRTRTVWVRAPGSRALWSRVVLSLAVWAALALSLAAIGAPLWLGIAIGALGGVRVAASSSEKDTLLSRFR